jgi:hypothetical protein
MTHATSRMISLPRYSMLRSTSVVMTRQLALGAMVTSPVIKPTSENSSYRSRYFWLLSACDHRGRDAHGRERSRRTLIDPRAVGSP